jgi:hypothetical protein
MQRGCAVHEAAAPSRRVAAQQLIKMNGSMGGTRPREKDIWGWAWTRDGSIDDGHIHDMAGPFYSTDSIHLNRLRRSVGFAPEHESFEDILS